MLNKVAGAFVRIMQKWMPDPFLFAVILTFLTYGISLVLTEVGPGDLLNHWYGGVFRLLKFAMQMILILVAGHALADAPVVRRMLDYVSGLPRSQGQAVVTVLLGAAAGSLLNWGFGLVVGAILARRVASRLRTADYAFLVAAAYSGFIVWESGLSSSIALISATPGSEINYAERIGGAALPLTETLLSPLNLVPVIAILVVLPILFVLMQPKADAIKPFSGSDEEDRESDRTDDSPATPATRLEESRVISVLLATLALAGLVAHLTTGGGSFGINAVILLLVGLGVGLHGTPIRYVRAVNVAARTVGPLIIQYPLYGGIQGMLEHSGAAGIFSNWFVALSTADTLPFWSYVSSAVLNFFVPSGGGHWVVQGPIVIDAANTLGASHAATAMGVAFGDQVANMVQPFWALPLLAIAGLSVRDIMGYCVISFVVGFTVFGAALLVFN